MKERPILFSEPMVLAILDGRKTQTRRTVKGIKQPGEICYPMSKSADKAFFDGSNWIFEDDGETSKYVVKCPYGIVGDRLYVREEHYRFGHWEQVGKTKKGGAKWQFIAETAETIFDPPAEFRKSRHRNDPSTPAWHKRPSRFMPKAISRTMLEITGVRVERLQDISDSDVIAEGIKLPPLFADEPIFDCKLAYKVLWENINGQGSWDLNPLVWVISFKRVD